MKPSVAAWSLACFALAASALTPAQWRSQSIYQVLTDRFARTDGSTTAECTANSQIYCGGTWQGIINKLDYIQSMGFTAVGSLHLIEAPLADEYDRSGYHQSWKTCPRILVMVNPIMGIGLRTSTKSTRTSAKRLTWWPCPQLYMPGKWYYHPAVFHEKSF